MCNIRHIGVVFKPQSLPQPELFVACSCRLVRPATSPFLRQTRADSQSLSTSRRKSVLSARAPIPTNGRGRPGIDPVVYFKMLMVGFFEDIASERGIAVRCQDSISIRAFLGYDLTQDTPDHSTLSIIRSRLGAWRFMSESLSLILQRLGQARAWSKAGTSGLTLR